MTAKVPSRPAFCGSYRPGDVEFLLKPIAIEFMQDVARKEQLIQSGQRHYSEMLSPESLPSARYIEVFEAAMQANLPRMAADCLTLAQLIAARRSGPITIVSLMRAGTPIGVIQKHLLTRGLARQACHYSVSIIRDRGIDQLALRTILADGHAPASLVFVDGWTGKGVISHELDTAIGAFNRANQVQIDPGLYVLADLAGTAACAASHDDYLIPSSILNATISGLVSRSILNEAIGPGDFHGCVCYPEFAPFDRSRAFADAVIDAGLAQLAHARTTPAPPDASALAQARATAQAVSRHYLESAMARHGITDVNLIKPGIGEATRVLLRRVPRRLIVRDASAPACQHLLVLAAEKAVPVEIDPDLPYQAVSLIASVQDS